MNRFAHNDIVSLVGAAPRHDLGESYGPNLALDDLLDGAGWTELGRTALGYGTIPGDAPLRGAIAELHGVDADDVVVTVGAAHALFLIAFILCRPGDEVVTTAPLFPPARGALDAVGANVKLLRLDFDQGYRVDLGMLRALLSPATRLVSLASPQNPSGVAIPRGTLAEIVALMRAICPQACLLVDETYREAVYANDAVADSAIALGEKVISVASLSKCHGAPGLRLGWAVTRDAALREQLLLGKFNTVISCSPLDEALALRLLARRHDIVAQRAVRLSEGLRCVADWAAVNGDFVEWVRPDAGALCVIRLKPSMFSDGAVARFHQELASADVRVANGAWFGDETRVFRLGFGLPEPAALDASLRALTAALRQAADGSPAIPARRRQTPSGPRGHPDRAPAG
jgi:aspartate/methionine/tyrosine aminotransferase